MSQQPFQDTAAPQCDVVDAAEGGDGGAPGEIKAVCAESYGTSRRSPPRLEQGGHGFSHRLDLPNQTTTYIPRFGIVQAF